jgi:hypothetical protein
MNGYKVTAKLFRSSDSGESTSYDVKLYLGGELIKSFRVLVWFDENLDTRINERIRNDLLKTVGKFLSIASGYGWGYEDP